MIPTVGRTVHYTNLGDADNKYPPTQQAAIVTAVKLKGKDEQGIVINEECNYDVSLVIFYTTGCFFMDKVPYSREYMRGHWTWPAKV